MSNKSNFGEFADFDEWFVEQDINEIRENANKWKKCTTEELGKAYISQYYVR